MWTTEKHNNHQLTLKLKDLLPPQLNLRAASDPRDHVYGVLGLIDGGHGTEIIPNYTKSLENVLVLATSTLMKDEDGLDVLFETEVILPRLEHPSWVPNWAFDTTKSFVLNMKWLLPFDSSKGQPAAYKILDKSKLEVMSLLIGNIKTVYDVMSEEKEERWAVLRQWRKATADHGLNPAEFWPMVFSGTVMDSNATWHPLDAKGLSEVEAWALWVEEHISSGIFPEGDHDPGDPYAHVTTSLVLLARSRQLFVTTEGRFGVGFCTKERNLQVGDEVHIVCGCSRPLVLGPTSSQSSDQETSDLHDSGDTYRLIGSAYVPGMMNGEAFEDSAANISSTFLV
jgi:hypothetical protein